MRKSGGGRRQTSRRDGRAFRERVYSSRPEKTIPWLCLRVTVTFIGGRYDDASDR